MHSGFILLWSSLASAANLRKRLFLNDGSCMIRPTIIDMSHFELKYYPFIISLNKFTGTSYDLSSKICVPKETKNINVKAFNMITSEDEAKAMTEHDSCDCKENSLVQHVIQNKAVIKNVSV